tara:strand:- start:226 stop:432 length:207 start_codon:yes stop_codon:yes gene_type:complete
MSTLDLMLIIGYLLLLISVFTLIQIAQYHTRTMDSLNKQIQYWRQQALNENKRERLRAKGVIVSEIED